MSKLLVIALLLLPLINHGIYLATAWDDQDFFKYCPPTQCSQYGPEIRYPSCLESSNTSAAAAAAAACGCSSTDGLIWKLACSGQDTILVHPVLGSYSVSAIDYRRSSVKLIPLVDPCLMLQQKLAISRSWSSRQVDVIDSMQLPDRQFSIWSDTYASLVCCSSEFTPAAADAHSIAGPVSCLSNTTHFFYLVDGYEDMSILPLDCKVFPVSDGVGGRLIPMYMFEDPMSHTLFSLGNDSGREREGEAAGDGGTVVHPMEPEKPAVDDKGREHVNGEAAESADATKAFHLILIIRSPLPYFL